MSEKEEREKIRQLFANVTGKSVHWVGEHTSHGYFVDRDWTLEVFDVPAADQYPLFKKLAHFTEMMSAKLDQPIRLLFHTPEETARLYAWVHNVRGYVEWRTSRSTKSLRCFIGEHSACLRHAGRPPSSCFCDCHNSAVPSRQTVDGSSRVQGTTQEVDMSNESVEKKMTSTGMLTTPLQPPTVEAAAPAVGPSAPTTPPAGNMTVAEAGRKGGQKVSAERGPEFYRQIGAKGGAAVKTKHGAEFYARIGKKGGDAVKATRGPEFYEQIGKKGGNRVKSKYGAGYYKQIGHKGGQRIQELLAKGRKSEEPKE